MLKNTVCQWINKKYELQPEAKGHLESLTFICKLL